MSMRVDFPLPDLPTTQIMSPLFIVKSQLSKIISLELGYLNPTDLRTIFLLNVKLYVTFNFKIF